MVQDTDITSLTWDSFRSNDTLLFTSFNENYKLKKLLAKVEDFVETRRKLNVTN